METKPYLSKSMTMALAYRYKYAAMSVSYLRPESGLLLATCPWCRVGTVYFLPSNWFHTCCLVK